MNTSTRWEVLVRELGTRARTYLAAEALLPMNLPECGQRRTFAASATPQLQGCCQVDRISLKVAGHEALRASAGARPSFTAA